MAALSRYGQQEERRDREERCHHAWTEWEPHEGLSWTVRRQCERCWCVQVRGTDDKGRAP